MASKDKMCPYETKGSGGSRLNSMTRIIVDFDPNFKTKRVRVKCPECGRRMIGWVPYCHDGPGCDHGVTIPPHRRKGWWKKK